MDETTGVPAAVAERPGPANDTSKLLAALGYVFGIVAVIALLIDPYKDEKFVKFHAWQAIGLWVIWLVIATLASTILWFLAPLLYAALLVYLVVLAVKAYQGQYVQVPGVYEAVKGMIGE